MALSKIFLFVKDEIDTIQAWIVHHSKIVGINNLFIIDNGSTDGTLQIIKRYPEINLFYCDDFNQKEKKLNELMTLEKETADLLIPLDGDEFLSVKKNSDYILQPQEVKEYFNKKLDEWLKSNSGILSISEYLLSFPRNEKQNKIDEIDLFYSQNENSYAYFKQFSKIFFLAKDFLSTDGGNHNGKTLSGNNGKETTELVIFHLWNLGWEKLYQKEIKSCIARGYDVENESELEKLMDLKAKSWHKIMNVLHYKRGTLQNYWQDELDKSVTINEFRNYMKTLVV
ncbi:MAG: glycosyltransferase family 2 protein [Cyclobacteriaceae bacterium]